MIRDSEDGTGLLPSLDTEGTYCIQPSCKLMGMLRKAQAALLAVPNKYTLADLLNRKEPLTHILMPPRPVETIALE